MPERMVYNHTNCWTGLYNGDPEALGYLYDAYSGKLFEAAAWMTDNREQARDALQEVFINLWNYRRSLGEVKHPQSYLVKMLQHILLKKLKIQALTATRLEAVELHHADPNAEERLISGEMARESLTRLHHACDQLTERQQAVIRMRFYEGLSYRQIAAKLSMNYQSVNNLVFRALLHLRKEI